MMRGGGGGRRCGGGGGTRACARDVRSSDVSVIESDRVMPVSVRSSERRGSGASAKRGRLPPSSRSAASAPRVGGSSAAGGRPSAS